MLMNFTEAIRKSNLAKQEVLKTREEILKTKTTAEDIKTALIEQGVDIADVSFDDIAQFIKENNIGANGPWERPKEWLTLPKVVAEESKYTDKASSSETQEESLQLLDDNKVTTQDLSMFQQYLGEMTNLSEVTTGMENGVFNVSANDFAYEMLCKVEENSDNLLLFEGISLVAEPFTKLSSYEQSNFLTDLFIQIDDEEPLNLTQLAKGEITLPTEGKYKNIAIISEEALVSLSPMTTDPNRPVVTSFESVTAQETDKSGLVENNIYDAYNNDEYPISLLISLDYNSFSDDVKMKNGNKQCIIKIWGNGFIRLLPYRTFSKKYPVVNNFYTVAIKKANDCILDAIVCGSNIDIPLLFKRQSEPTSLESNMSTYEISNNNTYLPLTMELLLVGFGDATQKLTLVSSLKAAFVESFFGNNNTSGFLSFSFNVGAERYHRFYLNSLNDFNFYMNLKEIDCSDVNYYNSYINMANFLFSTPLIPSLDIHSMSAKVKNVENVIFPNFKADLLDNDYYQINNNDDSMIIYPYCFNLSAFKLLKRDAILDLINKLPSIDVEINKECFDNVKIIHAGSSGGPHSTLSDKPVIQSLSNSDKTIVKIQTEDIPDDVTVRDMIVNEFRVDSDLELFNGKKEILKTYLYNQFGIETNENKCLSIRLDLDKKIKEATSEFDLFLDEKWFHSILVSSLTFKELTEEDIKLAKNKGWRIVTGLNYPINPFYIRELDS